MEFYNLGENGPQVFAAPDSADGARGMSQSGRKDAMRSYLLRYILGERRLQDHRRILFIEEETDLHGVLKALVEDENFATECEFTDSLDRVADLQKEKNFDLIVANYYEAEDEIDYEFWEKLRHDHPLVSIVTLSHVNDREYYELLGQFGNSSESYERKTTKSNLKHLLENVFGGWHGNY